ncbi:MAG: hypothetical protein MJ192_06200 [Clostridia bacterium]|nr:hypothetical protein [Clostridia bacterium]
MSRPRLYRRLYLCLLCLLLTVSCLTFPASAVSPPPESAQVGAACLVCLDNNQVLYEKRADVQLYPASTVKIMTGLLACRALADRMDAQVTLTSAMLSGVTGRSLHLAVGEVLTVRDLLFAALCGSYNDAACALAVIASGSVSSFVSDMNDEAARLGAVNTYYTNPTGLHDESMTTTLHDTVTIAREAAANELYMAATSASSYTIPPTNVSEERVITNRNALLSDTSQIYRNGYCRGMSAGMTDEGGWCVATVCERNGASLLCVVMQGADVPNGEVIPAYTYVNSLLSWARTNYGYVEVFAPGASLTTVRVGMTGLSSSETALLVPDGLSAYLPLDVSAEQLETSWALTGVWADGKLTAPVEAGETVGTVMVKYGDEVVGTARLTAADTFRRNGFMNLMTGFRSYLGSRACLITVIIFLILLLIYIRSVRKTGGRYRAGTWKKRGRGPRRPGRAK